MNNLETIKMLLAEVSKAVAGMEDAAKVIKPSRYAVIGNAGYIKQHVDYISALCTAEITINQIHNKIGA